MDKKSIIGIVLIFVILVVFSYLNQPSKEEIEAAKIRRDSIAQVEQQNALEQQRILDEQEAQKKAFVSGDTATQKEIEQQNADEFGVV